MDLSSSQAIRVITSIYTELRKRDTWHNKFSSNLEKAGNWLNETRTAAQENLGASIHTDVILSLTAKP